MPYALCPGCDEEVYVSGRAKVGARVHCSGCDSDLEVIDTDPFELDWAYDDDEDWDDEDEDDDAQA